MQPDASYFLDRAGIQTPLIGFYDAPDPSAFGPLVRPAEGQWACIFMFYKAWLQGRRLHLTSDNYGCGGVGTYMFGVETRSRQEYIDFLYGEERLKASGEIMGEWLDEIPCYRPEHPHIIIGPLQPDAYEHLQTVTFLINPDQLSLLVTGAHYRHSGFSPPQVTAPFASGCGLFGPAFADLDRPGAVIGATDIAVRQFLPSDILAFTVTRPTFEQLCALDEKSFLNGPFWTQVRKKRGLDSSPS